MNCAQHTDTAAVAYCRSCGKALCEICKRDVQGTIFCESCLAERINAGASGGYGTAAGGYGAGAAAPRGPEDASPGLALFLGFIPGVGAFYNGQFLKGFVHVIVMSTLIWMSDHGMGGFAGLLIAAWVFYMVFDAWSTAKARRYGLPIPDPLGLNAILEGREGTFRQRVEQAGERMGTHVEYAADNIRQHWQQAGGAVAPGTNPGNPQSPPSQGEYNASQESQAGTQQKVGSQAGANPGFGQGFNPGVNPGSNPGPGGPGTYYSGPGGTFYSGPEGTYYDAAGQAEPKRYERSPVGAVVLIGLGVLFLLANLGWFSFYWISHFWPVILIVIGLWLFVRRQRSAR
jgi:TM2 domain-containing membrane protein YozV